MAQELPFTKMQGAGNDYVYINGFEQKTPNPEILAKKISDRHFGVGSDGLVLILPSTVADVRMRMFNADGSEAEMCGNASRCVGKFAYDKGLVKKDEISLETAAGIKIIRLKKDRGAVTGATVDMGKPVLEPEAIPVALPGATTPVVSNPLKIDGEKFHITAVSMGNPHAVLFMEGIDNLDLTRLGPRFECHAAFPYRTNTEFVEVISPEWIKMRVWERGAGETYACGTGACAACVACVLNGLTSRRVKIDALGGRLEVYWDENTDHVFLTGPAVTVFEGRYNLQEEGI